MADIVKITVFGDKDIIRKMERLGDFHKGDVFKTILYDAANMLVMVARDKVPRRSWILHGAIRAKVEGFGTTNPKINFGARVRYAGYVEYPTVPHPIAPKNKRWLHWGVRGKEKVAIPAGVRVPAGVDQVFKRTVRHPGTQAQPFFFPAVEAVSPRLLLAIQRSMQATLEN